MEMTTIDIKAGDLVEFIENHPMGGLDKGSRVRVNKVGSNSGHLFIYYTRPDNDQESDLFAHRFRKIDEEAEAERVQKIEDLKLQIIANNPTITGVALPEEQSNRFIYIDVGDIPADRAEEFMDRMKAQFQGIRNIDKNPMVWFDGLLVYFFTIDAGMLIRYILSHL
jgi:hypothetical protein